MPRGTLEVLLVNAKGLENTDFLNGMDPYVILTCRSQEQKSTVASGKGSEPEWNENFIFTITDSVTELALKIMDSDVGTADDFVGEATIPLEPLFLEGKLPPKVYNVVKDQEYKGEIRVALTFTPEVLFPIPHCGIRKTEDSRQRRKALGDGKNQQRLIDRHHGDE